MPPVDPALAARAVTRIERGVRELHDLHSAAGVGLPRPVRRVGAVAGQLRGLFPDPVAVVIPDPPSPPTLTPDTPDTPPDPPDDPQPPTPPITPTPTHPTPKNLPGLGRSYRRLGIANERAAFRPSDRGEAELIARRFDVLLAQPGQFAGWVGPMGAVNPGLRVFSYVNAAETSRTDLPDAWYAKNGFGQRLYNERWKLWTIDVGNPQWQADLVAEAQRRLSSSGYHGTFVDLMGDWPVSRKPINPRTDPLRAYTSAEWLAHTAEIGRKIRQATGKPVVGNGLQSGGSFFQEHGSSRLILAHIDAGVPEGFCRHAGSESQRKGAAWDQDRRMVVECTRMGKGLMAITKDWRAVGADVKAVSERYALATFLLSMNLARPGAWGFSSSQAESLSARPFDSLDIGVPDGQASKSMLGARWERRFTGGMVSVDGSAGVAEIVRG